MDTNLDQIIKELDKAKRQSRGGAEYWMGRDIQRILGYKTWENFHKVIQKASIACESAGEEPNHHFLDTTKMIRAGKGAMIKQMDYFLDRYACYLIGMNGDTSKAEIGIAQTYFAVQTRRQELQDKLTADERRIQLRQRVKKANRSMTSVAKQAGVQKYAVFHNAGYKGLYVMGLSDIRKKKGLSPKEDLLDCAGRTELAANEFRITQTEDKLVREKIKGEQNAIDTHFEVGKEVRTTIKKLGGTMPEDLPPETSIKKLTSKRRKGIKAGQKKIQ